MKMQARLAKAEGVAPHQVLRRHGASGFGWYVQPFCEPVKFLGRSGAQYLAATRKDRALEAKARRAWLRAAKAEHVEALREQAAMAAWKD